MGDRSTDRFGPMEESRSHEENVQEEEAEEEPEVKEEKEEDSGSFE